MFTRTILTLFLALFCKVFFAQNIDSPNIIFIFCDDLNLSGLGSDYNSDIVTPVLDSLVNEGIVFNNAYANATICGPSRASVFTGVHPVRSGHYGYQMSLNDWRDNPVLSETSTLFNHFKENGYDVFGSGKMFHGITTPYDHFTHFNEDPEQGPWPYQSLSHSSLPVLFNTKNISFSPLEDIPSFPQYTGWTYRNGSPFYFGSSDDRDLMGDELSVEFCDSLFLARSTQNDNPFFLTIGFYNPHEPFHVPQEYFDLYDLDSLSLEGIIPDCDIEVIAEHSNRSNSKSNYATFDILIEQSETNDSLSWLKEYIRGYYASVSFIDDQIGKVIHSLKENQLDENTIIVISSDHGYHLGRRCSVRKTTLNSEASRIPLIILGPDLETQIIDTPTSLIDLYPTFCEWGSIDPPANQLDGKSLIPIINGSEDNVVVISVAGKENIAVNQPGTAAQQHHSVVFDQFKLNLHSSGEYQFFDTSIDPFEIEDLSKESDYASFILQGMTHLSNLIPEVKPLANPWDRMFYGKFLDGLEAWTINDACEFGSFFEEDEFLQDYMRIIPGNGTAVLRNKSVLFADTGTHLLNINVLIIDDSVSFSQKITQDSALMFFNDTTLNVGWHSLSLPFVTSTSSLKKQCIYELIADRQGKAYISDVSITEEKVLSNLISSCEGASDMASNSFLNNTDSVPFELINTSLVSPGSSSLFPRSVLKFTPADSAGFIMLRGAAETNPTIGVFSSCNPGVDPLMYFDEWSDENERSALTNLSPGFPLYALIEQKALEGGSELEKFQAVYYDIPRAQIDFIDLNSQNWMFTLSPESFYHYTPSSIAIIVTGFDGESYQTTLDYKESGIYSGQVSGQNLPTTGMLQAAYKFQGHDAVLFGAPSNFTFASEVVSVQDFTLLNNQLSSSTACLSIMSTETTTNSVWEISMYDLMGKKIHQSSYFPSGDKINKIPVDLTRFTNGVYIFSIYSSGQSWTSPICLVE